MNGRNLALGAAAGLAGLAVARRTARGSRTVFEPVGTYTRVTPRSAEDETERVRLGVVLIHGHTFSRHELIEEANNDGIYVDDAYIDAMTIVLNRLSFPLRVYRGLNVRKGETPDPQRARGGPWWTWNKKVARAFAKGMHNGSESRGGVPWMVSGTIASADDVNWSETMSQYVRFSLPGGDADSTDDSLVLHGDLDVRVTRGSRSQFASGRALVHSIVEAQRGLGSPIAPGFVPIGLPSWPVLRRGLANRGYDDTEDFQEHVDANEDEPNPVEAAWRDVRARWKSFVKRIIVSDPLPIWRMIAVPSRRAARVSDVGVYWSWHPTGAEAYWAPPLDVRDNRDPVTIVFAGTVALSGINWPETVMAELLQAQESEIQLLPEARIHILRAYDGRSPIRVLNGVRLPTWTTGGRIDYDPYRRNP